MFRKRIKEGSFTLHINEFERYLALAQADPKSAFLTVDNYKITLSKTMMREIAKIIEGQDKVLIQLSLSFNKKLKGFIIQNYRIYKLFKVKDAFRSNGKTTVKFDYLHANGEISERIVDGTMHASLATAEILKTYIYFDEINDITALPIEVRDAFVDLDTISTEVKSIVIKPKEKPIRIDSTDGNFDF